MELTRRIEISAGLVLIGLIGAGCLLVVAPFVSSILWAAIICYATWPLHQRVERLCGSRRTLSAAIMTTLVVVITVLPFVLAASALDETMTALLAYIKSVGTHGLPPPPPWVGRVPFVGAYLQTNWAGLSTDSEKGHTFLVMLLDHAKPWLLHRSRDFGIGVMHLCISVFIAFFFYRDGAYLVDRLAEIGKRVLGEYSQHLVRVVGGTIRGVVYGFLGTAMVQGVLATIGYLFVGVPGAVLLGLLTFLLALMPFGPPLVWIPVTAWLVGNGHSGLAVFMAIWGFFVISGIDNILRPYLISRVAQLHIALVFLGALGGILAFGFIGLFLGPTLLAVGYAILREFLIRKQRIVTDSP
ncbi:MAG: AI-2E family transporter [Kiritimatiellia bacterium]